MSDSSDTKPAGHGWCSGVDKESQEPCECRRFQPLDTRPTKCEECGHGKSLHDRKPQPSSKPSDPTARAIFKKMTQGLDLGTGSLAVNTNGTSQTRKISHCAARKEAAAGLKGGKGKAKKGGSDKEDTLVRIGSVFIWPAGLDENGHLNMTKAPGNSDLPEYRKWGLAKKGPLDFDRDWDSTQVAAWIDGLFPEVWSHLRDLATAERQSQGSFSDEGAENECPPWILLKRRNRTLSLVKTLDEPDGWDLNQSKTNSRGSKDDITLFLGTRVPIPSDIYELPGWWRSPISLTKSEKRKRKFIPTDSEEEPDNMKPEPKKQKTYTRSKGKGKKKAKSIPEIDLITDSEIEESLPSPKQVLEELTSNMIPSHSGKSSATTMTPAPIVLPPKCSSPSVQIQGSAAPTASSSMTVIRTPATPPPISVRANTMTLSLSDHITADMWHKYDGSQDIDF